MAGTTIALIVLIIVVLMIIVAGCALIGAGTLLLVL